jgi:hypothetical protein
LDHLGIRELTCRKQISSNSRRYFTRSGGNYLLRQVKWIKSSLTPQKRPFVPVY